MKHSRISSCVGVMFAKAVQDHSPVKPPRGLISAQQSRHSTSSLKPSRTTVVNGSRHAWPPANNPLKRTAAQSNTTEPLVRQLDSNMSKTGLNAVLRFTGDRERVGKLHDTVYFDEDDFEDDADIDLDAEEPFLRKSSSNTKITYPALTALPEVAYPNLHHPTDVTSPDANPSQASGTIPWSSSPSQHKPLPPSQHTSATKLGKRRKLPWVSNSDQDLENNLDSVKKANRRTQVSHISKGSHGNLDKPKPPEAVQEIISRYQYQNDPKSNADDVKESGHGNVTPLPIDKASSSLPWNTTASAMKEGQRKLRQGLKKSMSNTGADRALEKVASSTKKAGVTRVHLSDEQKKVLNLVTEENKSVFFTGSAGTGKSVLLREIIKKLRAKHMHQPDRVAVTASTGLAACNIGGVTLHSFAGIGLGKEDVPELVKKIKRNQKAKSRWMRTKILIVDEISMVDGELFDKLEGVARSIRNNGRPFGGIQLVITGDFFQLPPVPDYGKIAKFSFDANTWNTSMEHTIGLTQVFRQKDPGKKIFAMNGANC